MYTMRVWSFYEARRNLVGWRKNGVHTDVACYATIKYHADDIVSTKATGGD